MTRSDTVPTRRAPVAPAPLTPDQRATLRAMLEQQRAFRTEQLMDLHRPDHTDRLNRPPSPTDLEVFATLAAGARAALRDVRHALRRMDEGRYGVCTSCGRPVELARLEILPQAELCLGCSRRGVAA